jgi:acyl dehydratase
MTNAHQICQTRANRIGKSLTPSKWITLDQAQINAFADITKDHQFIHLDDARAKAETPFGGTIAHGFLTISMASAFSYEVIEPFEGQTAGVNYGFDKIRFLAPVRAGSRIRGVFELMALAPKGDHAILQTHKLTIEIEGTDTPALVAHWLTLPQLGA